jgi:hypothetical protein
MATPGLAGAIISGALGGLVAGHDFVLSAAPGNASLRTIRVLNYFPDLNLGLTAIGVVIFLIARSRPRSGPAVAQLSLDRAPS